MTVLLLLSKHARPHDIGIVTHDPEGPAKGSLPMHVCETTSDLLVLAEVQYSILHIQEAQRVKHSLMATLPSAIRETFLHWRR